MAYIMASIYLYSLLLSLPLFPLTYGSHSCPTDYIFQLGGSFSDTGNLIRVQPDGPFQAAANPPYGDTFPGTPTGRWSDGRLIIDYIANALGLPLLEPFLDTSASFDNGVNFAVAGATALDVEFLATKGIIVPIKTTTLSGQLRQFRNYLVSTCSSTPGECSRRLNRSLVVVGEILRNDINYGLSQGRTIAELKALVPIITDAIMNATREVIQLGAVRVVVPGNVPIGCHPNYLNMFNTSDSTAYDIKGCLRNLNQLAIFQNNNLQKGLDSLKLEFPNIDIIYFDFYNAFRRVLFAAPWLGFDPTTLLKACCGNGTLGTCGIPGAALCSEPSRFLSWDGQHLTQEAYRRMSDLLILHLRTKIPCIFNSQPEKLGFQELLTLSSHMKSLSG